MTLSLDVFTDAVESLPIVVTLGFVVGVVVLLWALLGLLWASRRDDPPTHWLDDSEEPQMYLDRYRRSLRQGRIAEFRPRKKDR